MEFRQGIGVSPGIAIAEAFILDYEDVRIQQRYVPADGDLDAETFRFETGVAAAVAEMEEIQDRIEEMVGLDESLMFTGFAHILEDKKLREEILQRIRDNRFTAEYAVSRAFRKRLKIFHSKAHDEFFAKRIDDLRDIENRLLRHLVGKRYEGLKDLTTPVILIAKDLSPSQTATLPRDKIAGFATDSGGRTSHTAILARALEIPAVVGLKQITSDVSGGDPVLLDGAKGKLIIYPDEPTQRDYRNRRQRFTEFARDLRELRDLPAETLDGHTLRLQANIEYPDEIPSALEKGAQGIGLYRTEFLFDNDNPEPSEEEHYKAYSKAVELLQGRPLVIRTLDLGADKFTHKEVRNEPNPFLGCRSIRYCFERIDLFKTQLRAIYRASALGPMQIMLPMISSLSELKKARQIIRDVAEDLERERIPFRKDLEVGCMVEVPSAALVADTLAKESAFFSIGTNDLVQYTLAVDRTNERVAHLYQPAHPAVYRLIWAAVEAGQRNQIRVSLCGELAGEVTYIIPLIGMGVQELSMSAASIPEVKKVIRSITLRDARQVVETIKGFSDAQETEDFLRERVTKIVPELV